MASLIKQDGKFSLQFFDAKRTPKRKRVALRLRVKRDAQQLRVKLERDYALGVFDPWQDDAFGYDREEPGQTTLRDATAAFMDAKRAKSAQTRRNYGQALNRFSGLVGEARGVASLTSADVEAWIESTGCSANSAASYHRVLRVFFNWAAREGLSDCVPTDRVRLDRVPTKQPRFLSDEEERALTDEARRRPETEWVAELIVLACNTGLRRGELAALRWEHVDVSNRRLLVANTEAFTTKSGRERTVPLSTAALETLRQLAPMNQGDYVFGGRKPDSLTQAFQRVAQRAGVSAHLHLCRHTACSRLAGRGVPMRAIQAFAGHSSVTVTEIYAHLSQESYSGTVLKALDC